MKFSKSTELAIHGLWLLAKRHPELLFVAEMADRQHVSESYLAKVFQKLAREGLVSSIRGKHGGFTLAKRPENITIADVARAIETEEPLYDCMYRGRGCRARNKCLVRDTFLRAERIMFRTLERISLADLMASKNGNSRAEWLR